MRSVIILALVTTACCYSGILDYGDQSSGGWNVMDCQLGSSQSPIDVVKPEKAWALDDGEFDWTAQYEKVDLSAKAVNNSLKWSFDESNLEIPVPMSGGQMTTMSQIHFHWSNASDTGSEHACEGERYAAEMHLVTSYDVNGNTQYVVFNRFFEVVPDADMVHMDNPLLQDQEQAMFSNDSRYWEEGGPLEMNMTLFYGGVTEYLTYNGSLTTPDCDEAVWWVIIPETLPISQSTMEVMRSYTHANKGNEAVGNNVRDLQSTNGRDIFWYQHEDRAEEEEHHETEEEAKEKLECKAGEGIMYHGDHDHWMCDSCPRGQFGWMNECHACPPGKSTVDMGSSYMQCIPTRYIKCEMRMDEGSNGMGYEMETGMVCEKEFCPCNGYEECEQDWNTDDYGMCRNMEMKGSAGGVTTSVLLVAACLAYFGF